MVHIADLHKVNVIILYKTMAMQGWVGYVLVLWQGLPIMGAVLL